MSKRVLSPSKRKAKAALSPQLSSGELCAQTGLTRGALRLYERDGLLRAARRTPAGYRRFGRDSIDRVYGIQIAKSVGFTLAEIRDILDLMDAKDLSRARMSALLKHKLDAIDARIEQLRALRQVIAAAVKNPDTLVDPECDLVRDFARKRGVRAKRTSA